LTVAGAFLPKWDRAVTLGRYARACAVFEVCARGARRVGLALCQAPTNGRW